MIEQARRASAERRAEADTANTWWPGFLDDVAAPVFRQVAQALKAEGLGFSVHTPARALRLVSDKSADEFIELSLETSLSAIQVVGRAQYVRGRRTTTIERAIREGARPQALTTQDVLAFLLDVLPPLVER